MILELYLLAVIGFALGFDQHRSLIIEDARLKDGSLKAGIIDAFAWTDGIATIIILILGFFVGLWWWPLLAMAIGTGVNYAGRKSVPLEYRWIVTIGATLTGAAATAVFFLQP
jgi:hypothetical protein